MDKLPPIQIGSLVVLGDKFWHIGTVTELVSKTQFRFKSLDAYRDEFIGNTFYANVDEIEFLENE